MKTIKAFWSLLAVLCVCSSAIAEQQFISVDPNTIRLENYRGDNIVLWFTGSNCSNGSVSTSKLSAAEKNRLVALVLSGKATGKKVFFFVDVADRCEVTSFGMD